MAMFGAGVNNIQAALQGGGLSSQASVQPPPMSAPMPAAAPAAPLHPSFFGQGGVGRNMAGYIGDAILGATGHSAIYGPMVAQQHQQQAEAMRQMQLAAFKAQNPEPTQIQRNYAAFKQMGRPELAESYIKAQADPMTLMTDPTTGAVGFYPKGGMQSTESGGSNVTTVTDAAGYNALKSGDHFKDPEGNIRVKP